MNIQTVKLEDIISDFSYNINYIINDFLYLDNHSNANVYLIYLDQFRKKLIDGNGEVEMIELIHQNIDDILEVIFKKDLFITLGNNGNSNVFHFWRFKNKKFDKMKFELCNYIEMQYHQINKFDIDPEEKYLICYCLDNSIQKLNIDTKKSNLIYNINHWIYYSLPNHIIDQDRVIYCNKEPKILNIKTGELNDLKYQENYSIYYIKKITCTGDSIYLLSLDGILYQFNMEKDYNLKYIYDLGDNHNLFLSHEEREKETFYYYSKDLQIFKYKNQIYTNLNFVNTYDNNKYLIVKFRNNVFKIRNNDCRLTYKSIGLFNDNEKKKILFVIWCLDQIGKKIGKQLPFEMKEHIFQYTTLGDWK